MRSSPAAAASLASARQSGQLADQRSGTLVAERPDEQLAPNSPILSAWPLYMAMRLAMDALRASTACSPRSCNYHRCDDRGDQGECDGFHFTLRSSSRKRRPGCLQNDLDSRLRGIERK